MSRRITERIEDLEGKMDDMPSCDSMWETASDAARDCVDNMDFSFVTDDCVSSEDLNTVESQVDDLKTQIEDLQHRLDESNTEDMQGEIDKLEEIVEIQGNRIVDLQERVAGLLEALDAVASSSVD